MDFRQFVPVILALLGIKAFSKNDDGVFTFMDDQKQKLKEKGFGDAFLSGFATALAADFAEPQGTTAGEGNDDNNADANEKTQALKLTVQLANAMTELNALKQDASASKQALTSAQTKINDLEAKIQKLINDPEGDPGAGSQHGQKNNDDMLANWNDTKQLGGFSGDRFTLDGRPYNQRARAAMLAVQGIEALVPIASSVDYDNLKKDLGDFYRVRWQDRLQSFLVLLPTIESLFSLRSGFQDRAVLVNLFLGEFSQSDNTGSNFDSVVKGNFEFDPEELRMFSVMFAHKFTDLKELETTWIGYLNENGSSVYKMSFIEFLLSETAKKLHNERERRRIDGVRVNPVLNQPGEAMAAADGLYEFIRKKVDGWFDTNRRQTVYQIKPFNLGTPTAANIGDYIYQGTKMLPQELIDTGTVRLYLPSQWITLYHKYNEEHYGLNQDYKPNIMYVKEYPSVEIKSVPNASRHNRFIWTIEGNFNTYEHLSGEMYRFYIELQDWTIKVWSNWKESIWAKMVGYKYTNPDEMDYSRQMIFVNDVDISDNYFIPMAKNNSTPSVKIHTSIESVANTTLLTITDILDAEPGKPIKIRCGSTNQGIQITKTGKFALITADWIPAYGDTITLMKRSDGNFIEISRENASSNALMFAADATTPSLADGTEFVTGDNTQATAITNFTDAVQGIVYTIYGNGTTNASTMSDGGNFVLTAAMTLQNDAYIKLVMAADGKFYEIGRSN